MSRSIFTNEVSVSHHRGRKENLKSKRLCYKKARKLNFDATSLDIKRVIKSIMLDKEPSNLMRNKPYKL